MERRAAHGHPAGGDRRNATPLRHRTVCAAADALFNAMITLIGASARISSTVRARRGAVSSRAGNIYRTQKRCGFAGALSLETR